MALRWLNPPVGSFDNFGEAMRLLYVMSTGDGWNAFVYMMMAATEPGHAPIRNDYSPMAFFGIAWMFIGAFFALQLFVGVIMDSFDKIQKETDQSATLTPEQQQWVNTMKLASQVLPDKVPKPANESMLCKLLFKLISSPRFDALIMGVIGLNVLIMACAYWGMEEDVEVAHAMDVAMSIFGYIYYTEATIKLIALGAAQYFGDGWCRFDFFLVCVSLLDQLAHEALAAVLPVPPFLLRVMRLVRILRLLRLLKGAKELRSLLVTLVLSFPSLLNVASLLAMVIFVYAVLGLQLFCFVAHGDSIDAQRNFETLGSGALLLFQCLTGDNWSGMMADAMITEESGGCSMSAGDCGSAAIAIPYFLSFQVSTTFIFLNLVVAVILENFSSLSAQDPNLVSTSDIDTFKEIWADLDPDADNYIASHDLITLVLALPPPMGLNGVGDLTDAKRLILKLKIEQTEGNVAFQPVLNALTRHNYFSGKAGHTEAEFQNLAVPEIGKPPPIPPFLQRDGLGGRSSGANLFAEDQPSVRRVYALQVIEKYMRAKREGTWQKANRLDENAAKLAAERRAPLPLAGYQSAEAAGYGRAGHGRAGMPGTTRPTPPRPAMRVAKHIEEEFLDEYGVSLSERELEMAAELVSTSQKRSPSKSSGLAVSEPRQIDVATNAATFEYKPISDSSPTRVRSKTDTGKHKRSSGAKQGERHVHVARL